MNSRKTAVTATTPTATAPPNTSISTTLPPINSKTNNVGSTAATASSTSVLRTQVKLHNQLQKHFQNFNPSDTRPILTLELGNDENSVFASLADYLFANNSLGNNGTKGADSQHQSTQAKWISSRVKINHPNTTSVRHSSSSSTSSYSLSASSVAAAGAGGVGGGGARGGAAPCCIQLSGINLYLGVKSTTERLVTEAGVVCNRVRRNGGQMSVCVHMDRKDQIPDAEYTSFPNRIVVAFFPGTKPITLKANMAKSLSDFFTSAFAFNHITPESYIVIPRKELVSDNFSGGNTCTTTTLSDQRRLWLQSIQQQQQLQQQQQKDVSATDSVWIAKSSHGAKGRDLKIIKAGSHSIMNGNSSSPASASSCHHASSASSSSSSTTTTTRATAKKGSLCYEPSEFLDQFDRALDGNPWVIQKYISRPLLYNDRKFDLRAWVLLTPRLEIFLYKEGVARLCSVEYDSSNFDDAFAHLSNNCLQEAHANFGKHEKGNLLSFDEIDARLLSKMKRSEVVGSVKKKYTALAAEGGGAGAVSHATSPATNSLAFTTSLPSLGPLSTSETRQEFMSFSQDVLPQMKRIIGNAFSSIRSQITPVYEMGAIDCFQYFGFDFMLDSSMKLWLLEVNGAAGVADYLLKPTVEDLAETVVYDMLPQSRPPAQVQQQLRNRRPNWFVKIFGKDDW